MSAVSALRTKRSQTFSGRRGNDSLLALRLPPSEINILRWVFSDLEGYVGLGSNFGRMCDNMRSGQLVKDLRESGWAVGDGPSDGDDFCKPAGAKTVGMDAIYMHVGTAHNPAEGFPVGWVRLLVKPRLRWLGETTARHCHRPCARSSFDARCETRRCLGQNVLC